MYEGKNYAPENYYRSGRMYEVYFSLQEGSLKYKTTFLRGGKLAKTILRYAVLLSAVASLTFGIYRGEVREVLIKAVNICLECIGIG